MKAWFVVLFILAVGALAQRPELRDLKSIVCVVASIEEVVESRENWLPSGEVVVEPVTNYFIVVVSRVRDNRVVGGWEPGEERTRVFVGNVRPTAEAIKTNAAQVSAQMMDKLPGRRMDVRRPTAADVVVP